MKWKLFLLFIVGSIHCCFAQNLLTGVIKDRKGDAIFAVNVYLKSNPQQGTITDFDGNFSLKIGNLEDTIIVSFIGYETKKIAVASINFDEKLTITLTENSQTLAEVIITAQDPISEQFSVIKMKKLDMQLIQEFHD